MNCKNHCNGKCGLLGGLEQKIMEVLWKSNISLKPSEILKSLSGGPAYTTITTVLNRMTAKKLVARRSRGHVFYYKAIPKKSEYAARCLDDLFTRLFDSYGRHVLTSFRRVARKFKYAA